MVKINVPPFEALNIDLHGPSDNPEVTIFGSYRSERVHNDSGNLSGCNGVVIIQRGIWAASAFYVEGNAVIIRTIPMEFPDKVSLEEMAKGRELKTLRPHHLRESILDIIPRRYSEKRLHELAREEAEQYLGKDSYVNADYKTERALCISRINDFISGEIIECKEEVKKVRVTSRMKEEFSSGLGKTVYRL